MKKKAFTLAEVLITLGIIGTVAALTIPGLITKHRKAETEAKIKQTYSILSNAIKMSEVENGPFVAQNWGGTSAAQTQAGLREFLFPYLKAQECGIGSATTCFHKSRYKNLIGGFADSWAMPSSNAVTFQLPNGVAIAFLNNGYDTTDSSYHLNMYMDVNGVKAPNTYGIDLFQFYLIRPQGGFIGRYHANKGSLTDQKQTCSKTDKSYAGGMFNGVNCAARIMMEGWQINYW